MEVCTHCKMYGDNPVIDVVKQEAKCEFCHKVIAKLVNGIWERIILPD